ncbi:MAG: hypothetical protein ACO1Q7_15455 [Gemmatimonas sp.]
MSTAKHQIEVARASDDPVTLRLALAAYSKALFAYQDLRGGALGSWHPEE